MDLREWALVIFTILAQMSVGAFWVLEMVHAYAIRKAGMEEAERLSDRALLAVGVVLILGLIASIFHLGNPLNAPRAITNFQTSWLSREILLAVLFALVGGLFALMQWRKWGTFAVRNVIAWIATLIGLVLILAMSRVYMLETQPAWNTIWTPVLFYTTTFLLGALAIGAALAASYTAVQRSEPECAAVQCQLLRSVIRGISVGAMVLMGVELVVVPLQIAGLASEGGVAQLSAALMYGQYGPVLLLWLVLLFVGAGVFGLLLYRNAQSDGQERIMANLVYAAFAVVLVAEVLGRFLFYATHVKIGL